MTGTAHGATAHVPRDEARGIQWNLTQEELQLVWAIAHRAAAIMERHGFGRESTATAMDVAACHLNGCTLRLRDLLDANDTDFLHDIGGIAWNIDRTTGRLKNHFVPRYALSIYAFPTRIATPSGAPAWDVDDDR